MKYVLVIGDGMADEPIKELDNNTPLSYVSADSFNRLAACEIGICQTIPEGVQPGSDTAIMNILGYDPLQYYTGRSVFEAAGMGYTLKRNEIALRINLCSVYDNADERVIRSHNGGNIHGKEAYLLMSDLINHPDFKAICDDLQLKIYPSDSFRHLGVITDVSEDPDLFTLYEPHNIFGENIEKHLPRKALRGKLTVLIQLSCQILNTHIINQKRARDGLLPANIIWPWGAAKPVQLPNFYSKYHHKGSVISAVPLVWGIAELCGLSTPKVYGATGDIDTNYAGKVDTLIHSLEKEDHHFAVLHVEAPDEMSHNGDLRQKLKAIQLLDTEIMHPLLVKLERFGAFRVLFISDHYTLLRTRTHSSEPVPYALYDSRKDKGVRVKFNEANAINGHFIKHGYQLLPRLFSI